MIRYLFNVFNIYIHEQDIMLSSNIMNDIYDNFCYN